MSTATSIPQMPSSAEYKRCFHCASCTWKSGIGWCRVDCPEFGCVYDGHRVQHQDRRGERDGSRSVEVGGTWVSAGELLMPSYRKARHG